MKTEETVVKLQTPKILIVDDKPQNLFALQELLKKMQADVIETTSGNEALALTLQHDFALALLDVQMPEMNGYELAELLHSNYRTRNLPIIFISAIYSDEFNYMKGYGAGAVDFLTKPFIPDILLSKVRVFLDLHKQRLQLQQIVHELNEKNEDLAKEVKQRRQIELTLREANTVLAEQTLRLETANETAQHITSILELNKLLKAVVNLIQTKFDYYFVGIWLSAEQVNTDKLTLTNDIPADKQALILQASAARDNKQRMKPGVVLPLVNGKGSLVWVYKNVVPHLVDDVSRDDIYQVRPSLPETQSQLALPILFGEEKVGVLDILSEQKGAFSLEDETVLQILANQIAIAIHNAQSYQDVQEANDQLARLNANKDKFLSILAHDLREPFTPVLGNADYLLNMAESLTPQELEKISGDIYDSAKLVSSLLNNLLQWGRMQMGQMKYQPKTVDLTHLIQQNVNLLTPKAGTKQISLSTTQEKPLSVYVDENMIDTVIRNLVSNALKFTPNNGSVTVKTKLISKNGSDKNPEANETSQAPRKFVEVSVVDTGVGISKEDLKKLFKIEVHHTTLGTAKEQGTGLGLIMCQEMVIKNGGQIWVESKLGEGTSFKFTVPCAENDSPSTDNA